MFREALMKQLELDLWATLKQAAELPELAELSNLWTALDTELSQLNTLDQLRIAGEAICQITDIVVERSFLTLEEIESIYQDSGPVVEADFFDKFVRQSMSVDFAQFVEAPAPLPRIPKPGVGGKQKFPSDGRSIVTAINKSDLLSALSSVTEEKHDARPASVLEVAHHEDISTWARAISCYFALQQVESISLFELVQSVQVSIAGENDRGSPLVKVWLALLLGGFKLEQHGEFYDYPDKIFVYP